MKKRKSKGNYIRWGVFSLIALVIGVIAGAVAAGNANGAEIIAGLEQNAAAQNGQAACFVRSAMQNLKITGLFWLMGMTVIGSFFAPVLFAARGYAVGMSVGILIKNYGVGGIVTAAAGVLPHTLITLPAYLLITLLGISFSDRLISGEKDVKSLLWRYTLAVILVFCIVLIGCLIEGYISLPLVKLTI